MKDFQLNKHNLGQFWIDTQNMLEEKPNLVVSMQEAGSGKWGMARLWRMWMSTTGEWMASQGVTMPMFITPEGKFVGKRPFNAEDAHELFTSRWLGVDENGLRLSWSRSGHDGMRPATKGERLGALRSHEEYANERGLLLFKPRDSEYQKLLDAENE